MTNQDLFDALESSIRLMESGIPIEDCLKEYPDIAPELYKLLNTVDLIKDLQVENIPVEGMHKNLKKLLIHAEGLRLEKKQSLKDSTFIWLLSPFKYLMISLKQLRPVAGRLVLALGLAGIFILFFGGLLVTSAKSLPGDSLYPVKRAVEDINVYLAPSGEVREEYEEIYHQKRVDEVGILLGLFREQQISFEGILTSMDDSQWLVSGIPVKIQSDSMTIIGIDNINAIKPGMRIEVEGKTSSQGWVMADEIHLLEYQYTGTVGMISQDEWQVSGRQIIITSSTRIDPGITVGDEVTVYIRPEDNGLFALGIVREQQPTITPTYVKPIEILLSNIAPPANEETTIENTIEHTLQGIVAQIGENYWIIDGDLFNIVKTTEFEDDIHIGDKTTVLYKIEQDGTFTAIVINRSDIVVKPKENLVLETPEATRENQEQGSTYETPTEEHKTEEDSEEQESEETPEPREVHHDH